MKRIIIIILIIISILTKACSSKEDGITLYAASSLTETFDDYNELISENLNLNFDSSTRLRLQIENGADADIYISANKDNVNLLKEKNLVIESREILKNRMVVITPKDGKINDIQDLKKNIKLVIAEEEVPCGKYAVQVIENYNEKYGSDFSTEVMGKVVSKELNVKQIVSKILMKEADAGIVYITDINESNRKKLNIVEIEEKYNIKATYWLCRISENSESERFYDEFFTDERMKDIFLKYGFETTY